MDNITDSFWIEIHYKFTLLYKVFQKASYKIIGVILLTTAHNIYYGTKSNFPFWVPE